MHWNHRRVRTPKGVRVQEVFYDNENTPAAYGGTWWRDFFRHPSWLVQALVRPVLDHQRDFTGSLEGGE